MDLSPPEELKPPCTHSSTPVTHVSRKRKHNESLDFPISPKFSSTLNESLITNLKDICLVNSVPTTPEKQRALLNQTVLSSPIQESRKILYSNIKVVKPEREKKLEHVCFKPTPSSSNELFDKILNTDVVMKVIFKHLSGGDLYRFSLVSKSCNKSVKMNSKVFERYKAYKVYYRDNKENYTITPPTSPQKCDSPPRSNSEIFNNFISTASCIDSSKSLRKCHKCGGVAVVQNEISQCQNLKTCGLIYCLRCSSLSETGPEDFKDACGHAILRPKLGNMSNHIENSGFFNFSSQDSGFYSENESPPKVKRNLFSTPNETPKALAVNNRNKYKATSSLKKKAISWVPVVLNKEQIRKPLDCDSPPRYGYAVGSKQSKKNLKRLTR